ncbi:hypothetical protein ID866_1232 [Astraeus odoratus]|nr:hypothetical protein ID866_1232 [Astraeus odoratus]
MCEHVMQKIQCTFKVDIPDMGHLGGGTERDIKALTKVPIPVWLAYIILFSCEHRYRLAQRELTQPKGLGRSHHPSTVRSKRAGGLWYGFGKMIMDILADEQANAISGVLTKTFRGRLTEVIDQAQHFAALGASGGGGSAGDSSQMFREGLDGTERELFALAQESAKRTKRWYESNDRARR